jgi:hypothetical protein
VITVPISKLFPPGAPHPKEEHWIPLSDLMTGMMMIFMLVAVVFMIKVEAESDDLRKLQKKAELQASNMKMLLFYMTKRGTTFIRN